MDVAAENDEDLSPSYTSRRRRFKVAVMILDGDKNISNLVFDTIKTPCLFLIYLWVWIKAKKTFFAGK